MYRMIKPNEFPIYISLALSGSKMYGCFFSNLDKCIHIYHNAKNPLHDESACTRTQRGESAAC